MELASDERSILERFKDKCVSAGGLRTGYALRKRAIAPGPSPGLDVGLEGLVSKGLLASNEEANLFFLTVAGVDAIAGL